ncbi:hypothetical protein HISP_00485 [Haloarcula hispanica N601]|uniref:Archaeal histidine kinase 4TM domain-containing protein n=3 Tax=Haloarcula hispanica TaxID=51589 RepID=V5TIL8_HALHI|nr:MULTISPECIES: hypothetical protein [Haloarcula]AEM55715.1 conserved hypothetical protein [Haloarcula hispanica ATCC 33960]AHB64545.1 hypothetical protein HISP_00485 [Haloarcula hispanica N601]AJF25739.1 hypothetical protein SG26_08365 [Haloarcula sp. CBA1115]KAA9405626.1 hypothetical protein Har1131_01940 [Haloarcula sp. CBA1131]KAA9408496.1 hypothetical protein EGO51_01370 [Haloarcula hispanica]
MNQRLLTGTALALSGVVLAAMQALHAFQQTRIPVAIAVDALPFVAMGLAIVYAGVWLVRDTTFEGATSRVAAWAAGGTVAFAAIAALLLFSQRVTSGSLARASYLTVDLVTVGALAGVLVGLYDARSRSRLRELAAERDRIEAFAGKAADVNNYGRAIASAPSVDGVAAFVVEAFGTMTGMEETAVIRLKDGDAVVLANTIRTVPVDVVGSLAQEVRTQQQGEITVHDRPFSVDIPESVTDCVSAVVLDDEGTATVVLSVTTDETTVGEEDQKLLELIVSHASVRMATLDRQSADREPTEK